MSEPTKAQLQEQVALLEAKTKYLSRQLDSIDPESRALGLVIEALTPLDKSQSAYTYPKKDGAIQRVLNAAAARFGTSTDWSVVERLGESVRLSETERGELERLRLLVDDFNGRSYNAQREGLR